MLKHLYIENIALIDQLDIKLNSGLNVLSGETGAGKSIIIDSLNLILGERATKELIKSGCDHARVEAMFDISTHENMQKLLTHNQIDINDDEVIVSRELGINGKNVCRVNGSLINLSELKKITGRLVDIHGQHENQSLVQAKSHIAFLDRYGRQNIYGLLKEISDIYSQHNEIKKEINSLCGDEQERQRNLDLLKYQIEEINNADLKDNEEQLLNEEKKRLFFAEQIIDTFDKGHNILFDDNFSVLGKLKDLINMFSSITEIDPKYNEIFDSLNEAYYTIDECGIDIRDLKDGFSYDPSELIDIEKRLNQINDLKRKYGNNIVKINEYLEKSQKEYDRLVGAEEKLLELSSKKSDLVDLLYDLSMKLSYERKMCAKIFEREMLSNLNDLGMKHAQFEVRFSLLPEKNDAKFEKSGLDDVAFFITTNLGQPLKPLSKVASGGEMSRLMLAFKNIIGDNDVILTNVFDEIDTGISGNIANVVAEKLSNISQKRQVICVTHLAQIAAVADQNYLILKREDNGNTLTEMKMLSDVEKVTEVARLAGGVQSDLSEQYAKELIEKSNN
jgi:DNA repair protein RecN (Recombination protein N)